MPNRLTPDDNANNSLDILRCKMNNGEKAYMELARSIEEMTVEIIKEDIVLIKYKIPWSTRVQSSYLSHPGDISHPTSYQAPESNPAEAPRGSSKNPIASVFDPWRGFNKSIPGIWQRDKIYMCVPGMESAPSRKVSTAQNVIPLDSPSHFISFYLNILIYLILFYLYSNQHIAVYLEFIQHHLLMGVKHIFLTAPFGWGGKIMTSFLRILRSFIEDGSVSMTSHSDDNLDYLYSTSGLSWYRDSAKVNQV